MKLNFESLITSIAIPSLVGLYIGRYVTPGQTLLVSSLIVILFSFGFFILSEAVLYLINYSRFERTIQGHWISMTESQNKNAMEHFPYSISALKYDALNKQLSYSGFSFDLEGKITAEWKSIFTDIQEKDKKIIYVYEGHVFNEQGDTTTGLGHVRFSANIKGDYITATGNYRGAANEYKPVYYKLIKLTPALCQELIKKNSVLNVQDMKNIILNFRTREDLKP